MKISLADIGVTALFFFIIFIATISVYRYVDGAVVYAEIKDSIIPREPYDTIEHIELYGQASDGWYIARVLVVDKETNSSAYNMLRYNRDTKEFVIPSESFGDDSCIEIKNPGMME